MRRMMWMPESESQMPLSPCTPRAKEESSRSLLHLFSAEHAEITSTLRAPPVALHRGDLAEPGFHGLVSLLIEHLMQLVAEACNLLNGLLLALRYILTAPAGRSPAPSVLL